MAQDGFCASCDASTGYAVGCAASCPACVNAYDNFVASCAGNFTALNYEVLDSWVGTLAPTNDCFDWLSVAKRAFAASFCSAAFDHVVQYSQSALQHDVVIASGAMTSPYMCLRANATFCPAECQADLNLVQFACHAEDSIRWAGNGMPGFLNSTGAPNGTTMNPMDAFALFANGSASVPVNLNAGVASATPLPLVLTACSNATGLFPSYSPPPSPPLPPPPSPPPPSPSPPSPSPPSPPPPSPSPPSPPPPPRMHVKTANPAFSVIAALGLSGYTAATFSGMAQAAFVVGMAQTLDIAADDVAVVVVNDYFVGTGFAGRRLLAVGVNVSFAVDTDTSDTASALAGNISALQPSVLVLALQGAGLTLDASSIELTQQPTVSAKARPLPGASLPTVSAVLVLPNATLLNPGRPITLSATVSSSAPALSLVLLWTVVPASALNLSDPNRVGTALNTNVLGLLPGALTPGATYTFRLRATDAFGSVTSSVTVSTMSVPLGGIALASSANGTELQTAFVLSTSNWTDAYLPLQYSFSYTSLNNSVDGTSTSTLLADFSNNTSVFGFLLPAGTIVLQVLARNALGGVSLAPATTTVVITRQIFASAAAQASFISALVSNSTAGAAGTYTPASAITTVALVSSIADMLNDPTSQLSSNATAAADTRASLLAVISRTSAVADTPEALASAADAVGSLVGIASQISPEGATTALGVLQFISGGGTGGAVAITPAASAGVAAGLSSIASAALDPASPVSLSVLKVVSGVVNALASSLLSALTTPGAAPVTVTSPLIQMSVALDLAGSGSRLFSAPISAPGSKSSFASLPADLFAGTNGRRRRLLADLGVRTQFSSLAFDPHTLDVNSTGTTTLAFSTASGELDISRLSKPVYLTLPLVPLADGVKAQCQFWDKAALPQKYSNTGCVSLPDPLPPGHNVSWISNFTVVSDAELVAAWSITGPLVAPHCSFQVLDCSQHNNTRAVYPNPARPFDFPAVRCNASISTEPLLVISGSSCLLIQPNNVLGCYWNNSKHAFQGPGCVASGGPVQCACRHLTEFAGKSVASLPTADLSEMDSLRPTDLLTKLRRLFIAVISLFCGMHVGAGVAFVQDAAERRRLLSKLQLPDCGFEVTKSGAWLWRFHLEPLTHNLDSLSGSGVVLAARLGLPFARLRASIPDEFMVTTLANALGRKRGLSVAALVEDVEEQIQLMRRLSILGKPSKQLLTRISTGGTKTMLETRSSALLRYRRDSDATSDVAESADPERERLESLVGTALVLAFLQVAQLVPVVQLAQLVSAAKTHFAGVMTPAGWSFEKTQVDFVTLLSPGTLNSRTRWLVRARFFKLMMSQTTSGFWDPTSSVAFALCARARKETDALRTVKGRFRDIIGRLGAAFEEADAEGNGDITDTLEHFMSLKDNSLHKNDELAAQLVIAEHDVPNDDPLECQAAAIVASMPPQLVRVAMADSNVNAARVWTTLCCIVFLQELPFCWLWGDGNLYPEKEKTIVDAAHQWLEQYAEKHPSLKEALADDAIRKRAKAMTRLWVRTFELRVYELRGSPAIVAQRNLSQLHRTATEMMRALVMRHETFSVFLSEPLDGLQRWQMFMILVSVVCAQLLVNIWMYYARADECCGVLRAILNSGPDGNCPPVGPCRGFPGTCGDITAQFAELPVLPDYPNGMQDWQCHSFPDDTNYIDSFLVGLISLAVALPVTLFIATCFEIADDSEAPESWLEWLGWRKLVFGRRAHRRWHYTGPEGQPVRYVRWFVRCSTAPISETAANLCRSFYAWATGTEVPWLVDAREAEEEAGAEEHGSCSDEGDGKSEGGSTSSSVRGAHALMQWKRTVTATGVVGVYVTWAIFSWFIFTYGLLVYNLIGKSGEESFIRGWGVSYGLSAATEWKDIVVEALKGVVVLVVLERLLLTSDLSWMEDQLDYLCLQSLLFKHARLSMSQQVRLLFARSKRLKA